MARHCALILAHRNPLIFKELTGCLINAGMEVFAHIDAKTPVSAFEHKSQPVQFLQDRYPITSILATTSWVLRTFGDRLGEGLNPAC